MSVTAEEIAFEGELRAGDAKLEDQEFVDHYTIKVKAGQLVDLTMRSSAFDTYLIVVPPEGDTIENDDHSDSDLNAKVVFIAEHTGEYKIQATSCDQGETGKYKITGQLVETRLLDIKDGSLSEDDERAWKAGEFMDRHTLTVGGGKSIVAVVYTDDFDAYLSVHTPSGEVLYVDDPPFIQFESGKEGGEFTIVVTSFEPGETGKYSLEFRTIGEKAPGLAAAGR